jgi:leucyl aminopeptidase
MLDQDLPCEPAGTASRSVHGVRPHGMPAFLAALPAAQAKFLTDSGFTAAAQSLVLLPGDDGVAGAVLGLGADRSPFSFGGLATRLPEGTWRIEPGDFDAADAVLGFALGAYCYKKFKQPKRPAARLTVAEGQGRALSQAAAAWMVRDLINAPANLLGPAELADMAVALGRRYGASTARIEGAALAPPIRRSPPSAGGPNGRRWSRASCGKAPPPLTRAR